MAVNKQKKTEVLQQLKDLFSQSKSIVFTEYKGLSVKDTSALRKKLREKGVFFKVAKKTLVRIAAKDAGYADIPDAILEGQVGAAFSQKDEVSGAKTVYEFSKTNEHLKLLGALMEGRVLTQAEAIALAKIPSREELLTKLVGSLNAPISGFHGVLSGLLRNIVGVISAYKEKLQKQS